MLSHVVMFGGLLCCQALDASTADGESVTASVVTNGEGDASVATATVSHTPLLSLSNPSME